MDINKTYLEVTILSPLELKETDQTVEVCPLCIKNISTKCTQNQHLEIGQ